MVWKSEPVLSVCILSHLIALILYAPLVFYISQLSVFPLHLLNHLLHVAVKETLRLGPSSNTYLE